MYWVTGVILLIYLVLVYLLGRWLPLHGSDVWILRGVLALLGLIGAAVAFWYQYKLKQAKEAEGAEEGQEGSTDDLDGLVREAIRRLKQSTLGRGTDLWGLPIVFLLGESGATKTTVLIHSALDPELLAGQVYRDNDVLPTSAANLWYTRQAIFVDPAGAMMAQRERWRRLVKLLQPARFSAAVGRKAQAPRAAIVCFDCETFLRPGASEATVSAARRLSARLQEVSQLLGISFPVYVLFTRLDRISFFNEFVRGMSKDEVAEVLGATLPMRSLSAGVYADQETQRLTKAFDEIFYSLAERRILLLPRENDGDRLPGIYEFPRELRKLRTLLVQFLVDLLRPTQLGTNPFLRGFYFTGVRPVVVDDVVAAPVLVREAAEESLNSGATQIFRGGVGSQVAAAPAIRGGGPRRMPQWVFLTSLFNDILAKDRVALAASGSSSHVNLLRRVALAGAVLLGMVFFTGFTTSFFQNHALVSRVQEEIADLRNLETPADQRQPASIGDLKKLDRLRADLVDLADWEENGAPWSMRWGLYSGQQVYQDAKPVYFERFRRLLFDETQKRIIGNLGALPDAPPANAPNDAYEKTYNQLKAYLITTSYHDKSTKEFLTPVLMSHWVADRDIDKDRKDLASSQFDFYSTALARENPFSSANSPSMIVHSQMYLNGFAGIERYYVQLLARASQNNQDASFNEAYPDSLGVIASTHKVKGAFTRGGYQFVEDALKNPSLYMGGEEWVLGRSVAQGLDPTVVRQKLTERYHQDFVNEWNTVLKTSMVPPYSGFPEADRKLGKITDTKSPLMELFYFVSHNVDLAPAEVKAPFAPVQAVEPPGTDKPPDVLITPKTQDYVKALGGLQAAVHAVAQSPGSPDPTLTGQVGTAQSSAFAAVTGVITAIPVDNSQAVGNEKQVRRLLEEPIKGVDGPRRIEPIKAAGAAAGGFCSQLRGMYPFDPNSSREMPVERLYSLLAGDEWKKLNDGVKSFVLPVGSGYQKNPSATANPSPEFLRFMSKMKGLGDVLFPNGSAPPHFSYTLKQLPSNLEGVQVTIGNEKLSGSGAQKTFLWTGAPDNIDVSKNGDTLDSASGPWAVFHFVARANHVTYNNLEWVIQNNGKPVILPSGKVKSYDYQLQVSGTANPFFDMPGLKCVTQVVK